MSEQEKYEDFRIKIIDLIEENGKELTPHDVIWVLIGTATSCALTCAPNEMAGIRLLLECVQMGIKFYEESAS